MNTPASPSRSAATSLDFRTLQFLAEAVQLLEAKPFQHRMHFFVYRKMLDELRVAVCQPGARRHAQRLASVHPAIAELLPGYQSSAWFGLFGPARMPSELVKSMSDAARQAIGSTEVKKRIEFEGATPVGNAPDEFARFVHEEIGRWSKVVKYSGAKPE